MLWQELINGFNILVLNRDSWLTAMYTWLDELTSGFGSEMDSICHFCISGNRLSRGFISYASEWELA